MLDLAVIEGHLQRVIGDFPVPFIRKGILFSTAAVRNSQNLSQLLQTGGVEQEVSYDLYVRSSQLPETIVEGEVWKVQESNSTWSSMKVIKTRPSPDNGALLTCTMAPVHVLGATTVPTGTPTFPPNTPPL